MSISAFSGPLVAYGAASYADNNPEQGTNLLLAGIGTLDPRSQFTYSPGQNFGSKTLGWLTGNTILSVYGPPMTLSTTKLSGTGVHIVANTPMTLISATTTGVAVGVSVVRQDTGVQVTGLLELDPLAMSSTANLTSGSNVFTVTAMGTGSGNNPIGITIGTVLTDSTTAANIPTGTTIVGFGSGNGGIGTYYMSAAATATATGDTVTGLYTGFPSIPLGQAGTIQLWHPGAMISRAVSITSTTSQVSGVVFTVNGLDVYGFPMTETLTTSGTSAATTSGKKAFKYLLSVTPSATDGTGNYSVGTLDVIGLPIRSDVFQLGLSSVDVSLMMNNAAITSSTGYVAAVKTTAIATTGDVRGTYLLGTASNGTLQFGAIQSPLGPNFQSSIGLFGVPQYAGF